VKVLSHTLDCEQYPFAAPFFIAIIAPLLSRPHLHPFDPWVHTLLYFASQKMGKAIIILPPSESGPEHGDKKPCATCHRLKGSNLFGNRDSPDVCNACNLVNRRMTQQSHYEQNSGSEIRGKAGYSKHGKHQENFSATKYIKP
jgi:hypothetical protein